jgi:hypothetical protein
VALHARIPLAAAATIPIRAAAAAKARGSRGWTSKRSDPFACDSIHAACGSSRLTIAIRRFYLAKSRWGSWLLSVATAFVLYVLNSAFMTAVQVAGAAIALALI